MPTVIRDASPLLKKFAVGDFCFAIPAFALTAVAYAGVVNCLVDGRLGTEYGSWSKDALSSATALICMVMMSFSLTLFKLVTSAINLAYPQVVLVQMLNSGVSIFACLTLTVGWMMMWKDPKLTNDNEDFTTIFDVTDPFDEKHWDRAYNGVSITFCVQCAAMGCVALGIVFAIYPPFVPYAERFGPKKITKMIPQSLTTDGLMPVAA